MMHSGIGKNFFNNYTLKTNTITRYAVMVFVFLFIIGLIEFFEFGWGAVLYVLEDSIE